MKNNRAIAYLRVSTEMQENGTSLENQKLQIRRYADLKGFEIIDIVQDVKSARNLKRVGMQRIVSKAKKKGFDHLIISKLDRGFRSTTDALETAKFLDSKNIGLHSVAEMIDTKSAMGEFFFTIMAAAAQLERARLSERMKDACALKKAKGERMGSIRYGYDLCSDGRKLKKNQKEQRVIKKILRFHEVGKNYSEISRYLNAKKIRTKTGKQWFPQQVKNVVVMEGGETV